MSNLSKNEELSDYEPLFAKNIYNSDRTLLRYWLKILNKAPKSEKLARNSLTLLMYAQLREFGHLRPPFTDISTKNLNDVLNGYMSATADKEVIYLQRPRAFKDTSESSNESKTEVLLSPNSKRFYSLSSLDNLSNTTSNTSHGSCTFTNGRTRVFTTTSKSSDILSSLNVLKTRASTLKDVISGKQKDFEPNHNCSYQNKETYKLNPFSEKPYSSIDKINSSKPFGTKINSVRFLLTNTEHETKTDAKHVPSSRITFTERNDLINRCKSNSKFPEDTTKISSRSTPSSTGTSAKISQIFMAHTCAPDKTFDSHMCARCKNKETDIKNEIKLTETELGLAEELNLIFDEVIENKMRHNSSSETSRDYTYRFPNYKQLIGGNNNSLTESMLPNLDEMDLNTTVKATKDIRDLNTKFRFERNSNELFSNGQQTRISSSKADVLHGEIANTMDNKSSKETPMQRNVLKRMILKTGTGATQSKQSMKSPQLISLPIHNKSPATSTTSRTSSTSKAASSSLEYPKEDEAKILELLAKQEELRRLCLLYYTEDGELREKPIRPKDECSRGFVVGAYRAHRHLTRSQGFAHRQSHAKHLADEPCCWRGYRRDLLSSKQLEQQMRDIKRQKLLRRMSQILHLKQLCMPKKKPHQKHSAQELLEQKYLKLVKQLN